MAASIRQKKSIKFSDDMENEAKESEQNQGQELSIEKSLNEPNHQVQRKSTKDYISKRHSTGMYAMQSFQARRSKPSVVDPEKQEDLYNELSKLRNYFMETEHKKQATWGGVAQAVLKRSKEEHTEQIQQLLQEVALNKKKEQTIEALKIEMLKLIKRKQIELNGREPETIQEQIQNLSNPILRRKFAYLDSKYKVIKSEIQNVNQITDEFGNYLQKMKQKQIFSATRVTPANATDNNGSISIRNSNKALKKQKSPIKQQLNSVKTKIPDLQQPAKVQMAIEVSMFELGANQTPDILIDDSHIEGSRIHVAANRTFDNRVQFEQIPQMIELKSKRITQDKATAETTQPLNSLKQKASPLKSIPKLTSLPKSEAQSPSKVRPGNLQGGIQQPVHHQRYKDMYSIQSESCAKKIEMLDAQLHALESRRQQKGENRKFMKIQKEFKEWAQRNGDTGMGKQNQQALGTDRILSEYGEMISQAMDRGESSNRNKKKIIFRSTADQVVTQSEFSTQLNTAISHGREHLQEFQSMYPSGFKVQTHESQELSTPLVADIQMERLSDMMASRRNSNGQHQSVQQHHTNFINFQEYSPNTNIAFAVSNEVNTSRDDDTSFALGNTFDNNHQEEKKKLFTRRVRPISKPRHLSSPNATITKSIKSPQQLDGGNIRLANYFASSLNSPNATWAPQLMAVKRMEHKTTNMSKIYKQSPRNLYL
ncbi:hypothetical protein FGO68_gene13738 [Halteria grandinella]|uniref:Uncharacterized protein n=1 Tax=Halteria grandinella TaxID=5974 RepID=A0A8J8NZD3_HALGN|nr:hypothetical protein FGO68_gene13738 [Halteria grandinella]